MSLNTGYTQYDIDFLASINPRIHYVASSITESECYTPRLIIRGRSGFAILWHSSLDPLVSPVVQPKSDRMVGIKLCSSPHDIIIFSVYLPCRTGCADVFRQTLDTLQSTFLLFPTSIVIFTGDLNADPGLSGGSYGLSANEQGVILARYLTEWDYVSAHLHFSGNQGYTYESEAHGTLSAIDHILCPREFLSRLSHASVLSDHPSNLSDHYPVVVRMRVTSTRSSSTWDCS